MLLTWYGQRKGLENFIQAGHALDEAVAQAIAARESTRDMGGSLGTRQTGEALVARLRAMS